MSTIKIDKDKVVNSKLWKPPDKEFSNVKTDSWFDLKRMNNETICDTKQISSKNIRSKPIIINPNAKQRKILKNWIEIYRLVYNMTINYINQCYDQKEKIPNFQSLRRIIDGQIKEGQPSFYIINMTNIYKIPKHTRDNAVKDAIKAYDSTLSNLKAGNIKHFRLREKRKDHHLASIVIEPSCFSKKMNGFASTVLGEMISDQPLSGINRECRLCYNKRTGIFILRVPYDKVVNEYVFKGKSCALDPGMRTFQTIYSPEGNCYEVCTKQTNQQLENLIKRLESTKKIDNYYKKFQNRLREKIRNKVKDLHYKLSTFLCRNFDMILVGNMSTKGIISKDRYLHKSTKKLCSAFSHYLFVQRLISKAEEYGRIVKYVDESYTSKTCGNCGEINEKLGGNEIFKCPLCNFKIKRDLNGARNIYLKHN